MRLIDADSARLYDLIYDHTYTADYHAIADGIDNLPTVDAVPVVRCKDCSYCVHFTDGHFECRLLYDLKPVPMTYRRVKENDYCSYGKSVTDSHGKD